MATISCRMPICRATSRDSSNSPAARLALAGHGHGAIAQGQLAALASTVLSSPPENATRKCRSCEQVQQTVAFRRDQEEGRAWLEYRMLQRQ